MANNKQQQMVIPDASSLPKNVEMEQEVLGSIMFLGEAGLNDIEAHISPDTFYDQKNKTVYEAILKLKAEHKPISLVDIAEALHASDKIDEIGGVTYLSTISNLSSTSYLKEHAMYLHQLEMTRDIYFLVTKAQMMTLDKSYDVDEIMEFIEKGMTEIQTSSGGSALSMTESISAFYEWLKSVQNQDTPIISSGLNGLDAILNGGFRSPDLIIIGGRPSMGKTQFAVHFAEHAAMQGKYVFFISIEMTAVQLIARMAAKGGVSYTNMRKGQLTSTDWDMIDDNISVMANLPINIADCNECRSLAYIKSEARRLKRKGELDMLIIDYLQLIRTNQRFEKRYIEIGYITGELKSLAKELGVPVILLAQLSRPQKGEEKKAPKMEDLRESGDIEQDADIIILPHRPWVYDQNAIDENGRSWQGRGKLIVAKNREGERNVSAYFTHDPQFKEFYDDEYANKV